jgi:glycosyltransferase involved in cell wall biosynthesis
MAAGKPILAPRQPRIEEVLKDGENALLFDEDSPKDLAEKIELIKNNPELADRIAKNAKQQSAKYTYQERAKRLLEYLNQLTT